MSNGDDEYLWLAEIPLTIAWLKKKKSKRAKTGTLPERAMKQWWNSRKWVKEVDSILVQAARKAEKVSAARTGKRFMNCLRQLLSEELSAEWRRFNRSAGRPKRIRGMCNIDVTKRLSGRPLGEPLADTKKWANFVFGVKCRLFADEHKFKTIHEVREHLKEHPNELDNMVSDIAAIEKAERILCAKRGEIFEPCRLPALKSRYCRAKRDFSVLNNLKICGGN